MMKRNNKGGFTAVELMASMLATSIVGLTAGVILYYGYRGWSDNNLAIEVQRDATQVMDMLSRSIRGAAEPQITMEANGIRVATTDGEVAFLGDGGDLIYHYEVGGLPTQMTLVDDRLAMFNLSLTTDQGVAVELRIQEEDESCQSGGFFGFRN